MKEDDHLLARVVRQLSFRLWSRLGGEVVARLGLAEASVKV